MRSIRIDGPRASSIVEHPDLVPKGEFVVVRIDVAPMCTEYKGWIKGWVGDQLGHEAAGTVVAADGARRVAVGDRVVVMPQYPCGRCRLCLEGEYVYCEQSLDPQRETGNPAGWGTYATHMVKPDRLLVRVPDGMSLEHASMANCGLGPAFGGARRVELTGEDTVLVTGLGPVGLGAVLVAKWMGARVVATDVHPYRLQLAQALGADQILRADDPEILAQVRSWSGGSGVDKVLECSGSPRGQRLGIDAIRRLGAYAFVGEAGELTVEVSRDFIRKGLTVHGSWYYNLADTVPLLRLISECGPQIDRLITHRFPMEQVEEAWALQERGECGKVLLLPSASPS